MIVEAPGLWVVGMGMSRTVGTNRTAGINRAVCNRVVRRRSVVFSDASCIPKRATQAGGPHGGVGRSVRAGPSARGAGATLRILGLDLGPSARGGRRVLVATPHQGAVRDGSAASADSANAGGVVDARHRLARVARPLALRAVPNFRASLPALNGRDAPGDRLQGARPGQGGLARRRSPRDVHIHGTKRMLPRRKAAHATKTLAGLQRTSSARSRILLHERKGETERRRGEGGSRGREAGGGRGRERRTGWDETR